MWTLTILVLCLVVPSVANVAVIAGSAMTSVWGVIAVVVMIGDMFGSILWLGALVLISVVHFGVAGPGSAVPSGVELIFGSLSFLGLVLALRVFLNPVDLPSNNRMERTGA